jgi:S-adenosyl-L-methionine hydrolase (adenosine-forming)
VPASAHRRVRPRLVTLTSDVGWAYAAQMRGVLLDALPPERVVELTHDLPPHAIPEAAFVLRSVASRFPAGTVHVVVVDPGVGGGRAPLVVQCDDGSILVGPDNGVLAPLAQALGHPRPYRIDPRRIGGGPRVGTTFDGRDLFAPTAVRLAQGTPASRLGTPHPMRSLVPPAARRTPHGAAGEVAHVDRFGNLVTSVPTPWVDPGTERLEVRFGSGPSRPLPWTTSYEQIGRGRLGALGSSFGTVEVAVAEGSAARRLRVRVGAPVRFKWVRGGGSRATETVNSGRRLRRGRR